MSPKKNRALLPPEDDDEGYVKQPAPSNPPAATNNSAVDDDEGYVTQPSAAKTTTVAAANDDEGYVTQPAAQPHQPTATATTGEQKVYDPDLDDYVYPSQQKKNQTPAATATVAAGGATAGGGQPGEQKVYDPDLDDYVYPSQQKKNQQPAEPSFDQPANAANYDANAGGNAAAGSTNPDGQNPQATAIPNKENQWQTKMFYDEGIPTSECLFGAFCFPCAQAKAKADLDGSSALWNCCCWQHGMTYAWFRGVYGIESNCGSDMMAAIFCGPCVGRRLLSEVRMRGPRPSTEKPRAEWSQDIFGCATCGCIQACIFPGCVGHWNRMALQNDQELDCCFDFCCFVPCASYGQVRHTYQLPAQYLPPTAEDICVSCVLYPCALDLAKRELKAIKNM